MCWRLGVTDASRAISSRISVSFPCQRPVKSTPFILLLQLFVQSWVDGTGNVVYKSSQKVTQTPVTGTEMERMATKERYKVGDAVIAVGRMVGIPRGVPVGTAGKVTA